MHAGADMCALGNVNYPRRIGRREMAARQAHSALTHMGLLHSMRSGVHV